MVEFFLYTRVSTEEQDEMAQRLEAKSYVDSKNYSILDTFSDKCSAWNSVPSNLVEMILQIERLPENQRPNILVKSVDRFSRSVEYGVELIKRIIDLGIYIVFYDTPLMNVRTEEGYSQFMVLLQQAEDFSRNLSNRVKESLEARRTAGYLTTRDPPFGKSVEEDSEGRRVLVENQEEIMIQALIAMLNGFYTHDQLMHMIRVYQSLYGDHSSVLTLYDDGFRDVNLKDEIFYGNAKDFADILNYFSIYKRGEQWNRRTIDYQWDKFVQPQAEYFEDYIEKHLRDFNIPAECTLATDQTFDDTEDDSNTSAEQYISHFDFEDVVMA